MSFNFENITVLTNPVLVGAQLSGGTDPAPTKSGTNIASACMDLQSTTTGFLPPRMTTTQKNAIPFPTNGMQVYDIILNAICVYNGAAWITIEGNGVGPFLAPAGSAAAPSFSFIADPTTGMYQSALGTLDFSTSGSRDFQIFDTGGGAVNYISVGGALPGESPFIEVVGTDLNIDLDLEAKNAGNVTILSQLGNISSLALNNTDNTFKTIFTGNRGQTVNSTYSVPQTIPGANTTALGIWPLYSDMFGEMDFIAKGVWIEAVLDHTDITSMYAAPREILGPFPGEAIFIHQVVWSYRYNAAAYTGGGQIYLQYGATPHNDSYACNLVNATLLTAGESQVAFSLGAIGPSGSSQNTSLVSSGGTSITIYLTNDGAAFASAGATGTISLWIQYSTLNL